MITLASLQGHFKQKQKKLKTHNFLNLSYMNVIFHTI